MAIAQTFMMRGVQTGGNRPNDVIPLCHTFLNSSQNTPTVLPVGGTFSNLIVRALTLQTTGTISITLFKNGVATAMGIVLDNSGLYFEDLGSVSFDAGDRIHFKAVSSAGSTTWVKMTMDWEPDIDNVSLYAERVRTFSSDPVWWGLYEGCTGLAGCGVSSLSESVEAYACVAGEIVGISASFNTLTTGGATFTFLRNNIDQDGSGGTPDARLVIPSGYLYALSTSEGVTADAAVHVDTADPVPIVALDNMTLKHTGDEPRTWCVAFMASTAGRFNQGGNTRPDTGINLSGSDNHRPPHAGGDGDFSAIVSDVSYYVGPTPITVDGLWIKVNPAPGVGNSVVGTIYKNGVATALTATISGTNTEASISQELTFVEGDYYSFAHHSTGTPGSNVEPLRWTFLGIHISEEPSPGESPSPPEETPDREPPVVTPESPVRCPCPPPLGEGPIDGGGPGPDNPGNSGTNPGGEGWAPGEICTGGGTVNTYDIPDPGESMADVRDLAIWAEVRFVEFDNEDVPTQAPKYWSLDCTLPDPPDAYGGRKDGRMFTVSPITRSMSDENGNYSGYRVTLGLNDKDRATLRARLGGQDTKYVWEREVFVYAASEANRQSGYTLDDPRTLAIGVTNDIGLGQGFTASISLEDRIVSQFGRFGPDRPFPSRLLTTSLLPGLPRDFDGKPQQWIFGEVSDEGAIDIVTGEPSSKGLVPLYLVGSLGTEDEYHLAAHPIGGLTLYGSNGEDPPARVLLDPSTYRVELLTLEDSATGELHNLTHVFIETGLEATEAHKRGEVHLAANVCGVLGGGPAGEGTATITNLFWIYQAVFELIVLPQRESLDGFYVVSTPQWSDGRSMVHTPSFAEAQTLSQERIGGDGYLGGFVIGGPAQGQISLRELLRRMSNSGDCRFAWTMGGQLMCIPLDDTTDVEDTPILREPARLRALPTPTYAFDQVENPVLYAYDRDYDKQLFRIPQARIQNDRALLRMGRPRPSPSPVEMWCTRDHMTARDVASRRLLRRQFPPQYVQVVEPVDGLDRNPGDIVRVTSIEGPGTGYDLAPMFIEETTFDPNSRRVTHRCRSLTDILEGFGEWATDGVDTWDAATEEQQEELVFWANDDDLIPTEMAPGQEWR